MAELQAFTPTAKGWTFTIVNSLLFQQIRDLPVGSTYSLSEDESTTPELIAFKTLGSCEYAWVIMAYNNFLDIRELSYEHGTKVIKIPDKMALVNLFTHITAQGES